MTAICKQRATALSTTFQRHHVLPQVAEQQAAADDGLQTDARHAIIQQRQALCLNVMHCHFKIMGSCCAYLQAAGLYWSAWAHTGADMQLQH